MGVYYGYPFCLYGLESIPFRDVVAKNNEIGAQECVVLGASGVVEGECIGPCV